MKINYENDVSIDGNALDQEWLQQPSLMYKYCQMSAAANKRVDETKEMLDVVRAGLDKDIRRYPEKYEVEKITDKVVESLIIVQESYTEAMGEFLQVKYEADMAKSAVRALEHKKDSLENLVKLYGLQYYSVPNAPYNINREWVKEEKEKKVSSGISQRLRRRKDD